MKKAIFVKDLHGYVERAKMYRMMPPYEGHNFIIAWESPGAVSGGETFLIGCDEHGYLTNQSVLEGSLRGAKDHKLALENIGYRIEEIQDEHKMKDTILIVLATLAWIAFSIYGFYAIVTMCRIELCL